MDLLELKHVKHKFQVLQDMKDNNFDHLKTDDKNEFFEDERNELRRTNAGIMDVLEENKGGFTGMMQNLEYQHAMEHR